VPGQDELLKLRNDDDDDDDDDEEEDDIDEENDEDVGLEYLQKPVDELEVCNKPRQPAMARATIAKVGRFTLINMSLTLSYKLVVSFCSDLCCFITKSSPRFRCSLVLNPAFSVASIESRCCGGLQSYRAT